MPEVLAAGGTLRRRMFPAVPEEEGTLFGTQITGSSAIDVRHVVVEQLDGIVGRDHLRASRASPLDHVACTAKQVTLRRPGSFAACSVNVDGSLSPRSASPGARCPRLIALSGRSLPG